MTSTSKLTPNYAHSGGIISGDIIPHSTIFYNYDTNPLINMLIDSYPTARFIFCPLSKPAVLMPITSPYIFKTAPPELPWDVGAVN